MFGNPFFRTFRYKMVTHARVFSLKPLVEINSLQGLFICSTLYYLNNCFGYENMCSWDKIKNERIKLPVKNGEIDFEFMESFVAELEAQHVAELEAYLNATGLKDYNLTEEEIKLIIDYDSVEFKSFNLTDIFEVKNTSNILACDINQNSGIHPYLCASAENNGISSYINYDKKYLSTGNCIFIGGKTFVVTYQEKAFFSNDSHNLALYLKESNYKTKLKQLYLITCIYSSLSYKYSWGDSISNKKSQKDIIYLPVKDDVIDYEYMEKFVKAIQKIVIKNLVIFNDKKLKSTRSLI